MSSIYPSRAIVDLSAYAHNLRAVAHLCGPDTGICAIVKANAYGHGAAPMAKAALAHGARMLGVATIAEGLELRKVGITAPILVLFQPAGDPASATEALGAVVEARLTLMLSETGMAEALGAVALRANRVVPVHCLVDTGMGRQGFGLERAVADIQHLTRISHIDIEGVATHFPVANHVDDEFTLEQLKAFKRVLKALEAEGIPFEMAHAANSPAIVNYPASHLDMVRPGLMTYGVWPSDAPMPPGMLRPVLRWETRVTQVRELEPGSNVGYGRTYTTPSRMTAAILPVGYADGYRHGLANKAEVLIRGQRCPVRGSVCMDQIVVDVTLVPEVHTGDIAVLIGADGDDCITAEELAMHAGTIPYEILTGIGHRVPRIYLGEGVL
jgi:alanine racemase